MFEIIAGYTIRICILWIFRRIHALPSFVGPTASTGISLGSIRQRTPVRDSGTIVDLPAPGQIRVLTFPASIHVLPGVGAREAVIDY